jgi:hypothetical protein
LACDARYVAPRCSKISTARVSMISAIPGVRRPISEQRLRLAKGMFMPTAICVLGPSRSTHVRASLVPMQLQAAKR